MECPRHHREDAAGIGCSDRWPPDPGSSSRRFGNGGSAGERERSAARPRVRRRPDPAAENITPSCSECGKTFWSWKAIFGHMRCHPERQWRGINPPAAAPTSTQHANTPLDESEFNEAEREVAGYLLLLASGPPLAAADVDTVTAHDPRFTCSGCNKVFGSHQGGHRVSHRNVKGCFAMCKQDEGKARVNDTSASTSGCALEDTSVATPPWCGICVRAFESHEALGMYRYCHGEMLDQLDCASGAGGGRCGLDLNLAPASEDGRKEEDPDFGLDLRLGL